MKWMHLLQWLMIAALMLLITQRGHAQQVDRAVVSSGCSASYTAGQIAPLTIDVNGKLCGAFSFSGTPAFNLAQVGGTNVSGANIVDAGNTAFRVNCVTGCTPGSSFGDKSTFTFGTTSINNMGAVFDDTPPAALTTGMAGALRETNNRALHVNLRNQSGTELATSSAPLRVDPTGATTQPVSGTVTANAGSGTFTVSGTVTANQGGSWGVTANAGTNLNTSLLALESGGNLAVIAGAVSSSVMQGNIKQINGVTPLMGNGVTGTGSPRVTVASDNTPFKVFDTGSQDGGTTSNIAVACTNQAIITLSGSGNTQIIAGVSAKKIYVCHLSLSYSSTLDFKLTEGTGSNCGTGTADVTGSYKSIQSIALDLVTSRAPIVTATAADALCINSSAATAGGGIVLYAQY